jgi:hypothetical protein
MRSRTQVWKRMTKKTRGVKIPVALPDLEVDD